MDREKETGLERILGRYHDGLTIEDKEYLAFNMEDYAQQACELYSSASGGKPLKHAATPFCPEGSLLPEDDLEIGEQG